MTYEFLQIRTSENNMQPKRKKEKKITHNNEPQKKELLYFSPFELEKKRRDKYGRKNLQRTLFQ